MRSDILEKSATVEGSLVAVRPSGSKSARVSKGISLIVCGLAMAGGIVLRWRHLGKASLWFDEGYTAWAVSLGVRGIVRVIEVDTAPPLYYIMLRGWAGVFGRSEAGLRSMSALMASVGLLFFAGISWKFLTSPWARMVAVVLFSASCIQVAYAHEARFYAMMTMMGAIDLYLVLLVCERSTLARLALLVSAWIASLYTNNLMEIYLACLGAGWLVLPSKQSIKTRLIELAIVTILCAFCFAPWVPSALAQTHRIQGAFWAAKPDGWDLVNTIGALAGIHQNTLRLQSILAVNLGLLALGIVSCSSPPYARRVIALFSFGLVPILLVFFYSQLRQPIFIDRAFLPSGIVIPLLVGLAIEAGRRKAARVLASASAVILIYLSLRSLPNHLLGEHPEAWREATAFAQSSSAKHRLVICVASDGEPLYRYYGCQSDYAPRQDVSAVPASFFSLDPPRTLQQVKGDRDLDLIRDKLISGAFDEVVLMASHGWWGDHDGRTLRLLSQRLPQMDRRVFTSITVFRFNGHSKGHSD